MKNLEERLREDVELSADEIAVIKMLEIAQEQGVAYEVVEDYFAYRRGGDSVVSSARCALSDWDCV